MPRVATCKLFHMCKSENLLIGRSVQWGNHVEFDKLPAYPHRERLTFRRMRQWYNTIMYATLMNEEFTVQALEEICDVTFTVWLLDNPESGTWPSGKPKSYIGFLDNPETSQGVLAFEMGNEVLIKYTDPVTFKDPKSGEEVTEPRKDWKADVIHQLPGINRPGNVTLMVYRRFEDEDYIVSSSQATPFMPSINAKVVLENSELSAKRMVNAINRMYEGRTPLHLCMHKLLLGNDYTPRCVPKSKFSAPKPKPLTQRSTRRAKGIDNSALSIASQSDADENDISDRELGAWGLKDDDANAKTEDESPATKTEGEAPATSAEVQSIMESTLPSTPVKPFEEYSLDYDVKTQKVVLALRALYNPSQCQILDSAWADQSFFTIITCPPGTEKSFRLAIWAAIRRNLGERKLLCGDSNQSVDTLTNKVETIPCLVTRGHSIPWHFLISLSYRELRANFG